MLHTDEHAYNKIGDNRNRNCMNECMYACIYVCIYLHMYTRYGILAWWVYIVVYVYIHAMEVGRWSDVKEIVVMYVYKNVIVCL